MTTKTIDILLNMQPKTGSAEKTKAGVKSLEDALKKVEVQANRTREKMEKMAQVGNRLAATGALIVAPFALAVNKYLESQKQVVATGGKMEKNAAALVQLQKEWAAAQIEVGKVATEILLPYLRQAVDLVGKIAAFAKEHPDAVKAALGIGASMVVIGGALSTVGSIVSTLATIQGLFASAGLAGSGAGAAAAGGLSTAGISAAFLAVMTNPLTWAVAGLVLIKPVMNWLLGTNQTWADIANTGKMLLVIVREGWRMIFSKVGEWFKGLWKSISDGFAALVNWFRSWNPFKGGQASGGYAAQKGLYMRGEQGREFVMSNATTKAAESVLGGTLTQQRLLAAMGGKRITYTDNRRIDASLSMNQRRQIANDTMSILSGAL